MRILYIGNWALNDGLTQSTVLPHLQILLQSSLLEKLVVVTIERDGKKPALPVYLKDERIVYAPLLSKQYTITLAIKMMDLIRFPAQLKELLRVHKINKVIARGSPAGALIYKTCLKLGIPYFVESFEPHADYMQESGVWKKWDPRYILEKSWEKDLKNSATGLMTVAEKYKLELIDEGIPSKKIAVVPCCVDLEKFNFREEDRQSVRKKLGIPEAILLIGQEIESDPSF